MLPAQKAVTVYKGASAPVAGAAVRKIATPDKRTAPSSKVAAPALKAAAPVKAPAIQSGILAIKIPQKVDAHATFFYYWPDYWNDKKSGRLPLLKLSSNHRDMGDILSGYVVWACTRRKRDGALVIVGRYLVSRAGQNREDDPDRRKGTRFFESDPAGFTAFDPDRQENIKEVILQALRDQGRTATRKAGSLQGHTVRRIGWQAAERLEQVSGFAPSSRSAGESTSSGPQNVSDTLLLGEQDSTQAIGIGPLDADKMHFDPESVADGRARIEQSIIVRRGQQGFRHELLEAYERRCAITGCDIVDVLEAAHVTPYLGEHTNDVTNGLLLRADLHTLFDCLLLAINPENRLVVLHDRLRNSPDYRHLHDLPLRGPMQKSMAPSTRALRNAWRRFVTSGDIMETDCTREQSTEG